MLNKKVFLFLFLLGMLVVGCCEPRERIIIQSKRVVVTASPKVKELTRVVTRMATPTPLVPTATPTPIAATLYLFPDSESDQESQLYDELEKRLEQRTGFRLKLVIPQDSLESMTALCDGQADVAWLSTPAYILSHRSCKAEAKLKVARYGYAVQVAQIVVQADAERKARGVEPLQSLGALDGKAFGFVDPFSTTGYMLPTAMLLDAGIELGEQIFLGGNKQAMLAVYRGEVDAAAAYWYPIRPDGSIGDGRAELLDLYPDVAQVTKILRLSAPMPNDPIVFRRGIPPSVKDSLLAAFIDLSTSREGAQLLYELYQITGLVPASDGDYDVVRELGDTLALDFRRLLEKVPY